MKVRTHKNKVKKNKQGKYAPLKQKKQSKDTSYFKNKKLIFIIIIFSFISSLFFLSKSNTGSCFFSKISNLNSQLLTASGLSVKKISIIGNGRTSIAVIKKTIAPVDNISMFSLNLESLKNKIEALPWVQHVSVQRLFPSTLKINIQERKPLALWQKQNQLLLIDLSGCPIPISNIKAFRNLPLVVGANANKKASSLLDILSKTVYLKNLVKSASLIYNRRWNLNLSNGGIVQLPEHNWESAISNLETLNKKSKLLDKNLELIDMRIPPQIILRLKSETAKRYKNINSPSLKKRPRSG